MHNPPQPPTLPPFSVFVRLFLLFGLILCYILPFYSPLLFLYIEMGGRKKNLSFSPGFTYYFHTGLTACTNVFANADDPAPLATKGN